MKDSIKELEYADFNGSVYNFMKAYKSFTDKNVKVIGAESGLSIKRNFEKHVDLDDDASYMQVDVFMDIPSDILSCLNNVIASFIKIYDTHNREEVEPKLSDEEKGVISAAKCINNMSKHSNKEYKISDIIYPELYLNCSDDKVKVKDGLLYIPEDDVEYVLGAKWLELPQEVTDKLKHKNQIDDYNKYFCGEEVKDTVIELWNIVIKYY